jgi:hypothetical protein
MSLALQKRLAVRREAERALKLLSAVAGVTSVGVAEESDLPPSVHEALRTLLQVTHLPFSTLDESATSQELADWLHVCLMKLSERQEYFFTLGGTVWFRIHVSPGSDWIVPLWQAFKDLFILSLPDCSLLGFFEEEHAFEAHLAQWT